MGWLIALAVVVLLGFVPLGIDARYDSFGPKLWVIAGPVRLKLLPSEKKSKKEKPEKKQEAKKEKPEKSAGGSEQKGGSARDFIPLVRVVWDFICDFRRKLRVNVLQLKITLAGDDPCDLAVNYGRACAAVAGLEPQLERFFVIRKKDIRVQCDFTEEKTLVLARLHLTITIGRLLMQLVRHGSRALKELLKMKKLRKGGALQ